MFEFFGVIVGLGAVLLVASIGLWKTGQLRKLFDNIPCIDDKVEDLADAYDAIYPEILEKLDELAKKLDELLNKK
jgi:hypothetical protein